MRVMDSGIEIGVASLLFGGEPFAKVLTALMERPGDLLTPTQIEQRTGFR